MSGSHAVLPVIALVGRPNVGKSTLFNRLTRTRDALVADQPGVTRDRQYGFGQHAGQRFIVIDTGGIGQDDEDIDARALAQTESALDEADVVLLIADYQRGLLGGDETIGQQLRRSGKQVVVVVNKTEGEPGLEAGADFQALALGQPWAISAEHGDRVRHLLDHVLSHLPDLGAAVQARDPDAIHLAVLGRPNAGKSTLVNQLVGGQRMLTQDVPGTTRDAVASEFHFEDQPYVIVDTAGIRRRARVEDSLERLSVIKAMQAVEQADVVILVLDAASGLSAQDIRLLGLAMERGRAGVIAVNKWDHLTEKQRQQLHTDIVARMAGFDYLPLLFISALHGTGLRDLLTAARESYQAAGSEISTAQLTRALESAVSAHPPPAVHGRRIKLRFAHMGGHNPPTIVIHGNQTQRLADGYKRYLARCFRAEFDLFGTPMRLVFKNSDNPYAGRSHKRKR